MAHRPGRRRKCNRWISHILRITPFLLLSFLPPTSAQFGEIASVITSLLGSSAGGLAGTGAGIAGPLASGAAAAGTGAAGALGGIGNLYQLAQAALQLTGTGVGIANQASESAWFPVAVENAAKMNRDLQDRLLNRGGAGGAGGTPLGGGPAPGLPLLPGLHGLGGSSAGTATKLGTEYGKNFESGEETESESTAASSGPNTPAPTSRSPQPEAGAAGPVPRRPLPGLVSLLPGESSGHGEEETIEETRPSVVQPGRSSKPSVSSVESRSSSELTHHNRGVAALISSGERQSPKPEENKPHIDFSIDEENIDGAEAGQEEEESIASFLPANSKTPSEEESGHEATIVETSRQIPEMVPELKKLIHALKGSNLTREDFEEIATQLGNNKDLIKPRENTEPPPLELDSKEQEARNGEEQQRPVNEKRDKAANRNLAALKSALANDQSDEILRKVQAHQQNDPPVVISLRRPNINRNPKIVHRGSGSSSEASHDLLAPTAEPPRARVFAVTPYPRRIQFDSTPKRISSGRRVVNGRKSKRRDHSVSIESQSSDNHRSSIDGSTEIQSSESVNVRSQPTQIYQQKHDTPQSSTSAPAINGAPIVQVGSAQTQPQQPQIAQQVTQPQVPQQQWSATPQQQPAYYYQNNNYPGGSFYYPQQYSQQQYYYPNQQQQYANNNNYQYYNSQQQPQYAAQTTPRTQPARTLPEPVVTTPPSLLHHPFGTDNGALLTLMQPQNFFGK
ncbi:CBR-PQN-40 protein [Ditylenchus destructor]|nr:CBR-PQN-40 protein [Ditylenchus destructor]